MSGLANYRILSPLGSGTFGQVKRNLYLVAEHLPTSTKVAIKILKKKTISENRILSKVKREIKVLKNFHHCHIIRLYEVIESPSNLALVLEYLPGGEVYTYLDRNGKIPEDRTRVYIQQIISGVEYIHNMRLTHRDIKLENLLLDEFGSIKLADFGLSNFMADGDFLKTCCGSPNYAAPEVLAGQKYSGPEVDIWSMGVVLYTLLSGFLPFDDSNLASLFAKIRNGNFVIPYHFSEPAKDLIQRMLNPDPIARITINQIKWHPWLQLNMPFRLVRKNSFIDFISKSTTNSYTIDEELFLECQKLVEIDKGKIQEIREAIINKIENDFTVCYYLLLDQHINGKKSLREDIKIPLFIADSAVSTANSSRSSSKNDFCDQKPESPSNWVYGFRSNLDASQFMISMFSSFKDSGLEWRCLNNLSLNLRTISHKNRVKMHLKLYKYENSYVLDFKLRQGNSMVLLEVLHRVYYYLYLRTCY
ncbi:unnamed protein product [Blepharisma stoltei]|uniref:Protein kinase domain-containing protein n=1 Tax=Blepharisma stoltei TaxID=1481888 RepID=A0AAU9K308_9CILI|nr:unnamed protein product [Blepharisma stoltei]